MVTKNKDYSKVKIKKTRDKSKSSQMIGEWNVTQERNDTKGNKGTNYLMAPKAKYPKAYLVGPKFHKWDYFINMIKFSSIDTDPQHRNLLGFPQPLE